MKFDKIIEQLLKENTGNSEITKRREELLSRRIFSKSDPALVKALNDSRTRAGMSPVNASPLTPEEEEFLASTTPPKSANTSMPSYSQYYRRARGADYS